MRTKNRVLPSLAVALTAIGFVLFRATTTAAIEAGTSYRNDAAPPMRELVEANQNTHPLLSAATPFGYLLAPNSIPPILFSFDGISNTVTPPHVSGAAGLNQYVQVAGDSYQVFDKATGNTIYGPALLDTLWALFGQPCQNERIDQATVFYDHLANRWVVSQLAGTTIPTDVCIIVSASPDMTGWLYRYAFHLGTNFLYSPHFGAWPDGYYMSVNVFNSSGTTFLGPQAFAFDRAKMVAGLSAGYLTPGITSQTTMFLPSDLDGEAPPVGSPNPFVSYPGTGLYHVRLFHADFVTPSNTSFTLIDSPAAAAFTQFSCSACVPQCGGAGLNPLGNRLMARLAYRHFADHDSIVGNYVVNSNNVAGIRWFELRHVFSSPVTKFQEATYQPDTTWRWTGSGAMDRAGNFALGFSAADNTTCPQIRYTGRLASDPPNTLPQGEGHLIDGGGGTQNSSGWGPDSSMTIDPIDDCTFWYTNEYLGTGSLPRTRIGNFRFKECITAPTPTPPPTPTPSPTPNLPPCSFGNVILYSQENFDSVTPPILPSGWIAMNVVGDAPTWVTSNSGNLLPVADTAPNSAFVTLPDSISDNRLVSATIPGLFESFAEYVIFRHNFNLQTGLDGGVLEISIDGVNGGEFQDILSAGGQFVTGGYNSTISTSSGNPLAGRAAWSGNSNGFLTTIFSVPSGPLSYRLRWRLGTDNSTTGTGWRVDSIDRRFCHFMGTPPPFTPTPPPTPMPTITPFEPHCSDGFPQFWSESFDSITPPQLPGNWTATNVKGGAPLWATSNAGNPSPPADSPPNSVFIDDPDVISDKRLEWNVGLGVVRNTYLTFRHNFDLQSGFDGGVLEVSLNGGDFQDILEAGGSFVTGGYNSVIGTATGSPIAGRQAWSGNSNGFITTVVSVQKFGDTILPKLRWRLATDNSIAGEGWRIDTVTFAFCKWEGTPSPAPTTPPPTAEALNISTRLHVGTGDEVMIGGFIITGTQPKVVAIRGIGPSLGSSGLTDFLVDPTLELRDSTGTMVTQNDNWQDDSGQAALLNSLGLGLQNSAESGLVTTLQPGAYTAALAGKNQTSGIGLVEIYDANPNAASTLANLSTRGFVQTGTNVMIGGFILGQGSNSQVIVRGIGPSLSQSGLTNVLADPTLELRNSNGDLLVANDNWQEDPDSAAQLNAHGLAPQNSLESGIFASLTTGAFTAILAGKDGGIGIGLVEVYRVQ